MNYYIGIDLGGTNVRTLLVDEKGHVYSEVKDQTEREHGPDYVFEKICKQIEALDCHCCGGLDHVAGIGIGVPGPVDTRRGVMIMATNLPGFENYPICDKLHERFHLPCFIDNDANVAGLAEALLGAGKGYPIVYYVTISTGIGAALVVDGKVVSGGRGHAGEVGNMIVNPGGFVFGSLNAGAAEAEASGTAITRKGRELLGEQCVHHAGDVFSLAAKGNPEAQKLVDQTIDYWSTMFANIAHTCDPYCFVLGGGVMKSKDYFMDELSKQFNAKIHIGMRGHIPLLLADLKDCGAIGAAMLPMSRLKS